MRIFMEGILARFHGRDTIALTVLARHA